MMGWKNYLGLLFLTAVIMLVPKIIKTDYDIYRYTLIGLHCIIVVGLSLFMGYTGQISLGQTGFYAIGAFTTGILCTRFGWTPFPTIFIGIALAIFAAMLIGIPSLRLRGHYLAMATLGFGFIIYVLSENAIGMAGGVAGVTGIPKMQIFGFVFKKDLQKFYLTWGTLIFLMALSQNIMNSRVGRACKAIHGNESAASAMGINVSLLKIQVFVISVIFASIAGSYYASFEGYISSTPFSLDIAIHLVILVAVGGMTSLWCALFGAVFLSLTFIYLEEKWQFFKDYKILFDGAILMVIMMFFPKGLFISIGEKLTRLHSLKIFTRKDAVKEGVAK